MIPRVNSWAGYASCVMLAVLGLTAGWAGAFLQAAWPPLGGLLLTLAGLGGLFFGGRLLLGSRIGGVVPAVAWVVVLFYLMAGRTEGDYVFGSSPTTYAYLLFGLLLAITASMLPVLHRTDVAQPSAAVRR